MSPTTYTPPESCLVLLLLAAAAVLGQISSLKPKDLKIAANVLLLLKVYLLFSWYEILFLQMGGYKNPDAYYTWTFEYSSNEKW